MHYTPLGTRAFDHFILEYDRQAKERGWSPVFGFSSAPAVAMPIEWFQYHMPWHDENDRIIAKYKPDIIQTSFHSAFEKPIQRLKQYCKRLAIIDHSSGAGPAPGGFKGLLRKLRGRRVGHIIDAIVCVSEFNAKRDIERVYLPASKVHVVPNGIDIARFPFVEKHNHPISIVFAGQLIEEKGVDLILDACRQITDLAFTVHIAGAGPLRSTLEATAPSNVTFLGQVSDMAKIYGSADIVIVPSRWAEAFGLVVIEAMACGAAVIASDAGALPEVVGDAGLIFRTGDVQDLASKLRTLLSDAALRKTLAQVGRRRVEESYQLHTCVARHLDLLDRIA
jgi:glycosyltransferase involved in cell wall biosynthesis